MIAKKILSTMQIMLVLSGMLFGNLSFANEVDDRLKVKVFILSGFEVGDFSGDAPGEFQYWVEGEQMNNRLKVVGAPHEIAFNDKGVFGSVCSRAADPYLSTTPCSELVTSLVLDKRLDFSQTYWIINGIAGIDPQTGSIGSAVWSANIVDGDAMRELGVKDRPADWKYGLYAIGATQPDVLPGANADAGGWGGATLTYSMNYALNESLAQWAYQVSKQAVTLKDSAELETFRFQYKGYKAAQLPPQILIGGSLGAARYWHGPELTEWARNWVNMWTLGQDQFYTTAMEQAVYVGTLKRMADRGLVDFDRVMMVRGASNYSMPPPHVQTADTAGDESLGTEPAFDALYKAGSAVIDELLANWDEYRSITPVVAD